MQAQARTTLSGRKVFAAASALLAASVILINGMPRTASAASALEAGPVQATSTGTIHEGVDWSRVAATPVDTGATVGAYR
jgi:hypothetical protein